nr:hypothetical protein [Tanacetum cinerariifolium]
MVCSMMSQTTILKFFWDYGLESVVRILNMVPTKKFFENSLISQESSGSLEDYEVIQEKYMHPSESTSEHHDEDEQQISKPESDVILVRRSIRTRHAPDRMCLYVESMNVKMQSMKDNQVWNLVDIPPNRKTVGSKWLFKKKTDMDGNVYTHKARLVAKGVTQTYGVDYKETFSPIVDIRSIRVLIAIDADRSRRLIRLCQSDYIEKVLKIFNMESSKCGLVPMQERPSLGKAQGAFTPDEDKRMQRVPYASVNPRELHWTVVTNILKYIRDTKYMFFVYGGDMKWELKVTCYTDVGYLTDADDSTSLTGYVFVLNRGVVDWKSYKQSIIATSTITIANEPRITKGAKYYRTKVHYLREVIELVASLFFWQGQQSSLAVGTYTASGNSNLAVGMPCAFYSQHLPYSLLPHFLIKVNKVQVMDTLDGRLLKSYHYKELHALHFGMLLCCETFTFQVGQ